MSSLVAASLLVAAGALVFLHWRRQGTRPPERLPTARFVPQMPVRVGAAYSLVRRGLLAARLALVGALALSVLGSVQEAPPKLEADAPAWVVVIDASASMAQRTASSTAWAAALARASSELLQARQRGEAVALFVAQAGATLDVPFCHDVAAINASLLAIAPGGPAALWPAIERAEHAASRRGGVVRGLVLTDGAAHAWGGALPLQPSATRPIAWAVQAVVPAPRRNDAIEDLQVESLQAETQVSVTIARHGGERGVRRLRLQADDEVLERASVTLTPSSPLRWQARLARRPLAAKGARHILWQARLEPDASDALATDDVRATWVTSQAAADMVALVEHGRHSEEPTDYVAHALARPMTGGAPIYVQPAASPAMAASATTSLLLLADVGPALDGMTPAVQARLLGGQAFAALQSLGDAAAAPGIGQAPPPLLLGQLRDARAPSQGPPGGRRLGEVQWRHPLLAGVDPLVKASLMDARIYRFWQVTDVPRGTDIVMRLDDGSPLLLAREADGSRRRMLLWTSTLSPQWTDVPLRSGFVPLLHHMATWLLGGSPHQPLAVERSASFAWRPPGDATKRARLRGPRGQERVWAAGSVAASDTITLEDEGLWQADRWSEDRWDRWPDHDVWVNAPAQESDLRGTSDGTGELRPLVAAISRPLGPGGEPYLWLLGAALLLALDALWAPLSSPKKAARVGVVPRV